MLLRRYSTRRLRKRTVRTRVGLLYPYQVEGVKLITQFRGRGLLADDMGLGKTRQGGLLSYYDNVGVRMRISAHPVYAFTGPMRLRHLGIKPRTTRRRLRAGESRIVSSPTTCSQDCASPYDVVLATSHTTSKTTGETYQNCAPLLYARNVLFTGWNASAQQFIVVHAAPRHTSTLVQNYTTFATATAAKFTNFGLVRRLLQEELHYIMRNAMMVRRLGGHAGPAAKTRESWRLELRPRAQGDSQGLEQWKRLSEIIRE